MANATTIIPFSASVQGMGIKVVATGTAGTLVHTTTSSISTVDRIYMWATNVQAAATAPTVLLTIEFGDATSPDHNILTPIPAQSGPALVIDGQPLLGSGSAPLTIGAFAATANVLMVYGYVMRIVP